MYRDPTIVYRHHAVPHEAIDFARSFFWYRPDNKTFTVRIQIECRLTVFDGNSGATDEYLLSVRTQTGLRGNSPSDTVDPGYDFWMIMAPEQIHIRRNHASMYNNNPSVAPFEAFADTGRHLTRVAADRLETVTDVSRAVRAFRPIVARTRFTSAHSCRGYAIEYPVKWADGDEHDDLFRVETGPVLLTDAERSRPGEPLAADDFDWAYLDYHGFDQVRCFLERPTSVLSGATAAGTVHKGQSGTRRNPALSTDDLTAIRKTIDAAPAPGIDDGGLHQLLHTNHYSEVDHRPAATELFALGH